MEKLPPADFVFVMRLAYIHPRVIFDTRFCLIRPASRAEVRRAAQEEVALD